MSTAPESYFLYLQLPPVFCHHVSMETSQTMSIISSASPSSSSSPVTSIFTADTCHPVTSKLKPKDEGSSEVECLASISQALGYLPSPAQTTQRQMSHLYCLHDQMVTKVLSLDPCFSSCPVPSVHWHHLGQLW